MTKDAWRQVVRYLKDLEEADGVVITDVAPESEYLYDESGNYYGINILFSCSTEPRKQK